MRKCGFLVVLAGLMVSGSASANLVTNGDFEAGNIGFTSSYGFVPYPRR